MKKCLNNLIIKFTLPTEEWKKDLGFKLKDKVKNVHIRKETKVCNALIFLLKAKWKWASQLARYKGDRWTLGQ